MVYFVATPIGNLKDITYRAVEILNSVDVIACEDTRVTMKLLNHYNIKKKLIAYHKHNEITSADGIVKLAQNGQNIAVVSDCGMPTISDPGSVLVNKLIENNVDYTVLPGANAALSSLLLSGFDSTMFTFVGFLNENNTKRKNQIEKVASLKSTLIFYVSPYNIEQDVEFIYNNLGKRKACFVKEITKMFETIYHFNLGEEILIDKKGEFVLVVEGCLNEGISTSNPSEELNKLIESGMSKSDAIKVVAKMFKVKKNEIYKLTFEE